LSLDKFRLINELDLESKTIPIINGTNPGKKGRRNPNSPTATNTEPAAK